MSDFDYWLQQQEKAPASNFDVDAFMAERRKPKPAMPRPKVQKPAREKQFRFDAPQGPVYSDEWLNGRQEPVSVAEPAPRRLPRPTAPGRRNPGGEGDPFEESLQDQAQRNIEARQAERERKRQEFSQKPWYERTYERTYDALARGGQGLANAALAASPITKAIATIGSTRQGRKIDRAVSGWQKERERELRENAANRPEGGFMTGVAEQLVEAAPQMAALGAGGGGGKLAMAAAGGLMTGANIPIEQWVPKRRGPGIVDKEGNFYPVGEYVPPARPKPKALKYRPPVDIVTDTWPKLRDHSDFQRLRPAEQRAALRVMVGVAQSDNPAEAQLHPDSILRSTNTLINAANALGESEAYKNATPEEKAAAGIYLFRNVVRQDVTPAQLDPNFIMAAVRRSRE